MITKERLQSLFYYKPEGGLFYKSDRTYKVKDQRAGYTHSRGYRHIQVYPKIYKEHILVWLFHGNELPEGMQIDHINNIRSDNRIENLRLSDPSTNQHNRFKNKNNTSGYKGVHKHGDKWQAQVMCKRKVYRIGVFDSPKEAAIAYNSRIIEIHGEFAKLNAI